jgi:flagellar biosynthesis/type III secretory pathway protein FliH
VAVAVEREAVELGLQVADKVIGAALEVRPEVVLDIVKGALRGMLDRERVTVQVHPDDLELVRGAVDDISGSLGGIDRLEVVAERRVDRGGAMVRTPVGEIDARVEEKLARAREVLQAELGA